MDVFVSWDDLAKLHDAIYRATDADGNFVVVAKTDSRGHELHAKLGGSANVVPLVGLRIGNTTFWPKDDAVFAYLRGGAA